MRGRLEFAGGAKTSGTRGRVGGRGNSRDRVVEADRPPRRQASIAITSALAGRPRFRWCRRGPRREPRAPTAHLFRFSPRRGRDRSAQRADGGADNAARVAVPAGYSSSRGPAAGGSPDRASPPRHRPCRRTPRSERVVPPAQRVCPGLGGAPRTRARCRGSVPAVPSGQQSGPRVAMCLSSTLTWLPASAGIRRRPPG